MRKYSLCYELLKRTATGRRKSAAPRRRIYDFPAGGDRQAGTIARMFLDRLARRHGKNALVSARLERLDPDDEMPGHPVAIPSEVRIRVIRKTGRVL